MSRLLLVTIATLVVVSLDTSSAEAAKRVIVRRHNGIAKAKVVHTVHPRFRHVKHPIWYYRSPYTLYPPIIPTQPTVVNPVVVNRTQPIVIPNTVDASITPTAQIEIVETPAIEVPVGSVIRLRVEHLDRDGKVVMKWKGRAKSLEVIEWYVDGVAVQIPRMKISEPMPAEIVMFDGTNRVNSTVALQLVAGPKPVVDES